MRAVRLQSDWSVDLGAFLGTVVGISSHLDLFPCDFT